jgi:hypothetical protein
VADRALSTRERLLILGAIVIFLSIIAVPLSQALAREYRRSGDEVTQAERRLRDAIELRRAIEQERMAQRLIAQRVGAGGRFSLYDFAQSELTRAGLGEQMRLEKRGAASQSMEIISVTLNGVGLNEIIEFLHSAYSASRPVAVQQLEYLRPARDAKGLDCSMTLVSPRV